MNTYEYAGGNPIAQIDRTGLVDWEHLWIGVARFGYGGFNLVGGGLQVLGGSAAIATIPILGWPIGISEETFGALRVATGEYQLQAGFREFVKACQANTDEFPSKTDWDALERQRLLDAVENGQSFLPRSYDYELHKWEQLQAARALRDGQSFIRRPIY
jgi:hypothetical protein